MTREEAIKIIELNKGRLNGSMQAALATIMDGTVINWRPCKAGQQFGCEALIRYPAYIEKGFYAKGDGDWVPLAELEQKRERVCGTCAYWQEGTLGRGICQAYEPFRTFSTQTCDSWTDYEIPPFMKDPDE